MDSHLLRLALPAFVHHRRFVSTPMNNQAADADSRSRLAEEDAR